jgi:hypothetical protein
MSAFGSNATSVRRPGMTVRTPKPDILLPDEEGLDLTDRVTEGIEARRDETRIPDFGVCGARRARARSGVAGRANKELTCPLDTRTIKSMRLLRATKPTISEILIGY